MPRHGFPPSAEVPTTGACETRRSFCVTMLQELGMVREGADVRAAFRHKHTQQRSVKTLQKRMRRGTVDPGLGYLLKLLRRELKEAKAAAVAASRAIQRLPDVRPEGIPD